MPKRLFVVRSSIAAAIVALATAATAVTGRTATATGDLQQQAVQAYIYAYPLVTMGMSRRVSTNVQTAGASRAPINQIALLRAYPTAAFTDVVAPNADTLYEIGWFDVSKQPIVLSLPALGKRYALFPMLSAWTNVFASPGTRTTGSAAQTLAVTGPGWTGTLPAGIKQIKSPTSLFWMIGRIYSDGTPADLAAVHTLQNKIQAVPLSSYGKTYTAPPGRIDASIDMKTPIVKQVNGLDGVAFFKMFAALLAGNPPAPDDAAMVAKLAPLGIVPGKPFDAGKLDSATRAAMQAAPAIALKQMKAYFPKAGKVENGWMVSTGLGSYGTNYSLRAFVALIGLGANLAQDAVYPATVKPLDGSKNYRMHFPKGSTPPARAFWSLTLYNKDQFFYDNPLNKYNVSQRNAFKRNPDGSFDVYIQHKSPGTSLQQNWLPSPPDTFSLIMRLYWPKTQPPSILTGTWSPPAVQQASMEQTLVPRFVSDAFALVQETPQPSPAPQGGSAGGIDLSKLTPEQQAAIQQSIIKASQNPVGNITILPFQNNFNYGVGPYTRYQYNLNIQPVVPIMLSKKMNLIARTIIPIIDQPSFAPPTVCATTGCGSSFGIGDVQEQLFFAPVTKPGQLIWGAGPLFQFPTGSPQDILGSGKWSAGPAAVGLVMPGRWVIGMLVTQLWSFAGRPDRADVNSGLFQPFFNYNLPKGSWAITTAPIITVNYNAPGDQKWTVPLGLGGGKTFKLGDQVMQINAFYYTNIVRPVTAPQTTLRIVWSLLFPIKRGINMEDIIKENMPK